MAVSYVFRQSLRRSTAFQTRWSVLCFCLLLVIALGEGGRPLEAHTFISRLLPCFAFLPILLYGKPAYETALSSHRWTIARC